MTVYSVLSTIEFFFDGFQDYENMRGARTKSTRTNNNAEQREWGEK